MNNIQTFSLRSDFYARHRPTYPRELFRYLSSLVERQDAAWDCATGNGQAALGLAEFFNRVAATDISPDQVRQRFLHPRVTYCVCSAEQTPFASNAFDLIGILSRTYGPEVAWKELAALLTQKERLVGLDLAGDEALFPGEWFVEHFRRGREAGWRITIHAGEIAGPESIWQAIEGLGAERIGHAVAAIRDPALMDYLAEQQIAVEGNLTSNVQTMTTADYASHPLRAFLERGICVTLNTDDPGISAIDLAYEYNVAAPAVGFSPEQVRQMQHNALRAAFLSEVEKAALLKRKSGQNGL